MDASEWAYLGTTWESRLAVRRGSWRCWFRIVVDNSVALPFVVSFYSYLVSHSGTVPSLSRLLQYFLLQQWVNEANTITRAGSRVASVVYLKVWLEGSLFQSWYLLKQSSCTCTGHLRYSWYASPRFWLEFDVCTGIKAIFGITAQDCLCPSSFGLSWSLLVLNCGVVECCVTWRDTPHHPGSVDLKSYGI